MNAGDWRAFCERLAVLGDAIEGDDLVRAEGYRHLANQVACWLTYSLGHTDPARPMFFRSSDPVYQWGGPNADQVARRAPISGDGVYRISGSMGTCEEFVLQVKRGASQSGGAEIDTELLASSLGLGPGDDFALVLGGDGIALAPDATFVHVRDYYFDWRPGPPATFVIERLDTEGEPPPAFAPEHVATILATAAGEIEHSMAFWSGYQDRMLAGQAPNEFGPPAPAGRGVQDVLYSHAPVSLRDDEALVVELDPPVDQQWDIQLYNRPWYEALDFRHRVTCLNHALAHRSDDGRVRVVIANRDPGCANWLDTEGRAEVLATIRWWHPPTAPTVDHHVVGLDALPDLPPIDAAARRDELRRRTAHTAWRYRT